MDQISKMSLVWNETNQFIEDFKETVNSEKIITVLSEDLFSKTKVVKKILNFIGVSNPYSNEEIKELLAKPVNKQKQNEYPEYKKWSVKKKNDLKKYAKLASKYNYNI